MPRLSAASRLSSTTRTRRAPMVEDRAAGAGPPSHGCLVSGTFDEWTGNLHGAAKDRRTVQSWRTPPCLDGALVVRGDQAVPIAGIGGRGKRLEQTAEVQFGVNGGRHGHVPFL